MNKEDRARMRGFATAITSARDVLTQNGYCGQANLRMLVENNGFQLADFDGCDLADIDMDCMRWVFADKDED